MCYLSNKPGKTQAKELHPKPGGADLLLRNATLRDVPLIFKLFMDGGCSGKFRPQQTGWAGRVRLALVLYMAVLRQSAWVLFGQKKSAWQVIMYANSGEELGFLKISDHEVTHCSSDITVFAVKPEFGNCVTLFPVGQSALP